MSLGRQIALTTSLLVGSILFFGLSNLDEWVQDLLYNSLTHRWLLDHNLQPYRFILYDGIKALLILFALLMLATLLFGRKHPWVKAHRNGILIVVLSAIIVPLTASTLKQETNMPCPKHTIRYGGIYPHVAVWEPYPENFKQPGRIQCWPAGHASGGFALLSLFFLFKRRENRKRALLFASTVGWLMGGYKMLIGDHYLSHTVITMLLSWLWILIIAAAVGRFMPSREDRSAHP